ncbi:hypothetical protein Hanom_Chr13g01184351 [Helianthus anomalus]
MKKFADFFWRLMAVTYNSLIFRSLMGGFETVTIFEMLEKSLLPFNFYIRSF